MQLHPPHHSQSVLHVNQQLADPVSNQNSAARSSAQVALVACVYIGLRCASCGDVRQALHELPAGETTPCPQCEELCSFVRLGTGQTRRELPFHEITSTGNQPAAAFRDAYPASSDLRHWQEA